MIQEGWQEGAKSGGAVEVLDSSSAEGRTLRRAKQGAPPLDTGRYGVKEGELKASLERAEAVYEELVRTRASLGTMLAEAIKRDGGIPEFRRRMEDLPFLIRSADVKRTELKVELLGQRLQEANKEHRQATEEAKRAGAALEEARRAYARTVNVEQRSNLEAQRLEELHREELGHLERLRSETAERREEREVATS